MVPKLDVSRLLFSLLHSLEASQRCNFSSSGSVGFPVEERFVIHNVCAIPLLLLPSGCNWCVLDVFKVKTSCGNHIYPLRETVWSIQCYGDLRVTSTWVASSEWKVCPLQLELNYTCLGRLRRIIIRNASEFTKNKSAFKISITNYLFVNNFTWVIKILLPTKFLKRDTENRELLLKFILLFLRIRIYTYLNV